LLALSVLPDNSRICTNPYPKPNRNTKMSNETLQNETPGSLTCTNLHPMNNRTTSIYLLLLLNCSCAANKRNTDCHKMYNQALHTYIYVSPEQEARYAYGMDSLYRRALEEINSADIKIDRATSLRTSFVIQGVISRDGAPLYFGAVRPGTGKHLDTDMSLYTADDQLTAVEKTVIASLYRTKDWIPAVCNGRKVISRVLMPFRINLK
jgi:hypothetical protein